MSIKQPGPYRLADHLNAEESRQLGVRPNQLRFVRAVATGEMRPPRKGEWYLSGAEVHAYRALNDLTDPYYIAKLQKALTYG